MIKQWLTKRKQTKAYLAERKGAEYALYEIFANKLTPLGVQSQICSFANTLEEQAYDNGIRYGIKLAVLNGGVEDDRD